MEWSRSNTRADRAHDAGRVTAHAMNHRRRHRIEESQTDEVEPRLCQVPVSYECICTTTLEGSPAKAGTFRLWQLAIATTSWSASRSTPPVATASTRNLR